MNDSVQLTERERSEERVLRKSVGKTKETQGGRKTRGNQEEKQDQRVRRVRNTGIEKNCINSKINSEKGMVTAMKIA